MCSQYFALKVIAFQDVIWQFSGKLVDLMFIALPTYYTLDRNQVMSTNVYTITFFPMGAALMLAIDL